MVSCSIECSIVCPRCDSSIILNGPITMAHCNSCQENVEISEEFWGNMIDSILEDMLDELTEGYGRNSTIFGEFNTRLRYYHMPPVCSKCKKKLDLPEKLSQTKGYIKCSHCDEKNRISEIPSWLEKQISAGKFLVNAVMTKEDEPKSDIADGVALTCPRCGGTLIVDGKERIVPCEFCSLHVFLPDAVWLRLHPVLVKSAWYVVFDENETKKRKNKD
ncbi:MAG: hypothetical protein FK734_18530 [Asgard group archaeon]|nr:hypothetical protein [Asgard group archaeon]